MTRGKTQLFGLLGVVALVTTMPIVVVAHQVSPSDSTPAPAACDVTPRSLADILSIGSGGSESATAVIAIPEATIDAGTFECRDSSYRSRTRRCA